MSDGVTRCGWARGALDVAYHDAEWGVPLRDDRALFELLILEGAQAGLSWSTILKKRDGYRRAFDGFDPARIARYGARDVDRLLADPGIVRNRAKIAATIGNARAFLELVRREGDFAAFLWRFVDGRPRQPARRRLADVPARTPESDAMSAALLTRGFKFVGSTICYAFMQASGMVNDHLVDCFRHRAVQSPTGLYSASASASVARLRSSSREGELSMGKKNASAVPPISIGIGDKDRAAIAKGLNELLADTYTLYLTTHNFHWNVTGPMFNTLHLMFMTQYTELWNAVDPIAERIRALGYPAAGSYAQFGKLSSIDDAPSDPPKAMDMVRILVAGHEAVARTARKLFPHAEKADDQPTADLLTQRLDIHEKTAWMLRSLLED